MAGEVIGINTAIFSQSGGSVGIGFAISANLATKVVDQLQEYGRTRRGWLGVFIQEVTEDIAESLGLDDAAGALVSSVTEDGPAEKGGVEAGDVITKFNGKVVTRSRDLPRIVAETPVDQTVPVEIIRNSDKVTLDITLGELEKAEKSGILASAPTKDEAQSFDDIGLSVAPLSKSLAEQFGLEADDLVVVVTAATEEGPSAMKGIAPGDIIRRLNQTRITSVADFAKVLETAQADERKGVLMLIESDGQTRFVQVSFK
jgi:serine protease Do